MSIFGRDSKKPSCTGFVPIHTGSSYCFLCDLKENEHEKPSTRQVPVESRPRTKLRWKNIRIIPHFQFTEFNNPVLKEAQNLEDAGFEIVSINSTVSSTNYTDWNIVYRETLSD